MWFDHDTGALWGYDGIGRLPCVARSLMAKEAAVCGTSSDGTGSLLCVVRTLMAQEAAVCGTDSDGTGSLLCMARSLMAQRLSCVARTLMAQGACRVWYGHVSWCRPKRIQSVSGDLDVLFLYQPLSPDTDRPWRSRRFPVSSRASRVWCGVAPR